MRRSLTGLPGDAGGGAVGRRDFLSPTSTMTTGRRPAAQAVLLGRWNDPKRGGVRMVTATGWGRGLLNGDFVRFSPQWVFHKTTSSHWGCRATWGACEPGGLNDRAGCERGGRRDAWAAGRGAGRPAGWSDCGGLPQQAIMAAAREMRRMAPDRFASVAQAMKATFIRPRETAITWHIGGRSFADIQDCRNNRPRTSVYEIAEVI